jgi:hypothetical protein
MSYSAVLEEAFKKVLSDMEAEQRRRDQPFSGICVGLDYGLEPGLCHFCGQKLPEEGPGEEAKK